MKTLLSLITVIALAVAVQAENVGIGVGSPSSITVSVPGGITGTTTGIFNVAGQIESTQNPRQKYQE